MLPAVETATVDAPDEVESAPLDVDLDGRPLVWTKQDVARVMRAGGTHDMRELAAALLGRTDVSVSVAGQTWRGPGTASVDLKQLGPDDELRIWPESDGTWSVARNVIRENGRAIHEHYRLEEVLALRFSSHAK